MKIDKDDLEVGMMVTAYEDGDEIETGVIVDIDNEIVCLEVFGECVALDRLDNVEWVER